MTAINIGVYVDVAAALAEGSLDGNVYLIDNNKAGGSTDLGTGVLKTWVQKGDRLLWNIVAIEPETYVAVTEIGIDEAYCRVERKVYEGSDVSYWEGVVERDPTSVPYTLTLELGTGPKKMVMSERPSLVGSGSAERNLDGNASARAGL